MVHRSLPGRLIVALALVVPLASSTTAGARAYDGQAATNYADAHWYECVDGHLADLQPPSPYSCIGGLINPFATYEACTNFVSQAMHAGGYSMVYRSSLAKSWWWTNGQNKTATWVAAPDLYTFLLVYDHDNGDGTGAGGGWFISKTHPSLSVPFNSLSKGDLIFMDQDNDTLIDHVRMEVGWNSSNDYADQHSVSRYHDFWNGVTHFANPSTVWVYQVHVDVLNT